MLLCIFSVFILTNLGLVDIDQAREPLFGSLLSGNNIISDAVVPSLNAISVYFYPIREAAYLDKWLYAGGTYQMVVLHFFITLLLHRKRVGTFISIRNAL